MLLGPNEAPQLVIVGPHGKYIEPWGAHVIDKYGLSAYPPTRETVAMLFTKIIRTLKLEMLWDQSTLLRRKDGSKVSSSNGLLPCVSHCFQVLNLVVLFLLFHVLDFFVLFRIFHADSVSECFKLVQFHSHYWTIVLL